jgi:hypothetical protein
VQAAHGLITDARLLVERNLTACLSCRFEQASDG